MAIKIFGNFNFLRAHSFISMKHLNSQSVLGILGSGQLARMTTLAASDFGILSRIYCNEKNIETLSPAALVASSTIRGSFDDMEKILEFCQSCDIVTLENEFIDQNILEAIDQKFPGKLFPDSKTFKKIGDKISEKNSFKEAGLLVVPFMKVKSVDDVLQFCREHGYPAVLKSAKGGYDGYGNITIKSAEHAREEFSSLKGELLIEAFIDYKMEVATMVARNANGEMVVYPVAHTIQEHHICHYVSVPAQLSKELEDKIIQTSKRAMEAINAIGIFAFEFFIGNNSEIYLNESAPRPHNSGHYTLEGCETSQFHNHVRSVFNLPLGGTQLNSPHVMMLNLLGTQNGIAGLSPLDHFMKVPRSYLHLYGKKDSKLGRKMGHYTILGDDKIKMFEQLQSIKSEYTL